VPFLWVELMSSLVVWKLMSVFLKMGLEMDIY
jgi:hypothetical protein